MAASSPLLALIPEADCTPQAGSEGSTASSLQEHLWAALMYMAFNKVL